MFINISNNIKSHPTTSTLIKRHEFVIQIENYIKLLLQDMINCMTICDKITMQHLTCLMNNYIIELNKHAQISLISWKIICDETNNILLDVDKSLIAVDVYIKDHNLEVKVKQMTISHKTTISNDDHIIE